MSTFFEKNKFSKERKLHKNIFKYERKEKLYLVFTVNHIYKLIDSREAENHHSKFVFRKFHQCSLELALLKSVAGHFSISIKSKGTTKHTENN